MSQNIPPKQTVTGTAGTVDPAFGKASADATDEPGALVSIHNAALHANPDSFPVLKAFQDYLETERKRARQRLIMLSAFFAILLVVVMFGLIAIGVYLFGNMSKTQNQLLTAVLEQHAAPAVPLASSEPARTEKLALDQDAVARAIEARVVATLTERAAATRPAAPPPPQTTELDELKAALATLQQAYADLNAKPKRPPTVGPLIPRAAVAHLLDPPAVVKKVAPSPASPKAPPLAAKPSPVPSAPVRTALPAAAAVELPPALPQPTPPFVGDAKKPLEQAPTVLDQTTREGANPLTIDIPVKSGDGTIPWRIILPPR